MALTVLAIATAAAAAESPSRALALWIGADGTAFPSGTGAADALALSKAWTDAGGDSVATVTGGAPRAAAFAAGLVRLCARARPGDLVLVGYSGPLRWAVRSDKAIITWTGLDPSGGPDISLHDVVLPALAELPEVHVAILLLPHGRVALEPGPATPPPAVLDVPPAGPVSFALWIAARPGQLAEAAGRRSVAAAALVRELERIRTKRDGGLADWLEAAGRRVRAETAGRQEAMVVLHGATPPWTVPGTNVGPLPAPGPFVRTALEAANALERMSAPAEVDAALERLQEIARASLHPGLGALTAIERHRLTADAARRARLALEAAELLWLQGRPHAAEEWALRAAADPRLASESAALRAVILWETGRRMDAFALVETIADSPASDDASTAARARLRHRALALLGRLALDRNDLAAARAQMNAARRALAEADGIGPLERLVFLRDLGGVEIRSGDPAAAVAAFREAIEFAETLGAREQIPPLRDALGDAHAAAGDIDAAIAEWTTAFETWPRDCGRPAPAEVPLKIGEALLDSRNAVEESFARLNDAIQRAHGDSAAAAVRLRAHAALMRLWSDRGDGIRALHHALRAWDEIPRATTLTPADQARIASEIAALYLARHEPARAADFAERALAVWAATSNPPAASVAATWATRAEALEQIDQHRAAAAAWSNAAVHARAANPEGHADWAHASLREARAWIAAGDAAAAGPCAIRAVDAYRRMGDDAPPGEAAEAALLWARAKEAAGDRDAADAYRAAEDAASGAGDAGLPYLRDALLRRAALHVRAGQWFRAREALQAADRLPPVEDSQLLNLRRSVAAAIDEALQPHGPIGQAGDMVIVDALELEYRARRAREPSPP